MNGCKHNNRAKIIIYIWKNSMGNSLHIFEVHLVETYFKFSNLPKKKFFKTKVVHFYMVKTLINY
jgi:hypothetical protein